MSHHPSAASTQQSHDRDALAREAPPRVPDHVLLRPIGRGSYGDVWLARSVMGTYRAVKIVYRRNFKEERPFEREFSGLQKFEPVSRTHEGLVDLLQVGRNEAEGYYYYVMELGDDLHRGPDIVPEQYEPKTLAKVVTERGRLSFEECLVLSLALARGLNHLHQHGLIHRDIKPSNIIFVNDIPKIADIGLVAGVGTSESFVGTEGFIPPEGPGTPQADIYSLGKVLYEISTGKDRHKFPEVPSDLGVRTDRQQFLELNEVILRACDGDLRRRYQSIEEMLSDLVLLHAGKSVKRLRLLEKRFAILTRAGAILAALACIAGAAFYQARQARIETTRRLASSYVTHGTLAVHQRDLIGSLPWYAEALRIEEGDPIRERRHRVHLSVVLGQCPILAGMWFDNVPINCVEFSPDGRWLAIAGGDGKVTLRDLEDPSVEPRIFRHSQTHEAETAAFSSDGELLLTSGIDGLARVWSLATCQEVSQALVHPEKIYSARFSPDGEWIVTACADGKVRVWERRTGALRDTLEHHAKAVRFADFSPDGQKIITSSQDWTALVIDLKTREVIGQPLRHSNWIYKACFSPDGRVVATCSFDGTARLWDVASGHSILLDHTGPVRSIAFSPDGRRVVTACWDYTYTVRVWDSATGKEVLPPLKHNNQVLYVGFNPNGRQIVTGSTHGVICLWDLAPQHWSVPERQSEINRWGHAFILKSNQVEVSHFLFHGNNPVFSAAGRILHFQFNDSYEVAALIEIGTNRFFQLGRPSRSQSDGRALASALIPVSTPPDRVPQFAVGRGANRLLVYDENQVEIWSWPACQRELRSTADSPIRHAAFSPRSDRLVFTTGRRALVFELPSGKKLFDLELPHAAGMAGFSENGKYLAVATTSDGALQERALWVYHATSGEPVCPPLEHADGILRFSFSPDSQRIVTASEDSTAQIWNAKSGRRIGARLVHQGQVRDAAFSPDGLWVVTSCSDGNVRVWDAATSEPITPPLKLLEAGRDSRVFFSEGNHVIIAREVNRPVRRFLLPEDKRPVSDLVELAQLLSGHQSDAGGGLLRLSKDSLQQKWKKLRASYPNDFQATTWQIMSWLDQENRLAKDWHLQQAASSEQRQQWFAAAFHLERLLRLSPDNRDYETRLENARSQFNALAKLMPTK